jgi:hypothetical protein
MAPDSPPANFAKGRVDVYDNLANEHMKPSLTFRGWGRLLKGTASHAAEKLRFCIRTRL